jgi:phage terminase Nu1 subunit (DNA packaging protein)
MDSEITSGAMQKLLGMNKVALNDLAKRGIVLRGEKRGSYKLEPSVRSYCRHLREQAAGRGNEAGADADRRLRGRNGNASAKHFADSRRRKEKTARNGHSHSGITQWPELLFVKDRVGRLNLPQSLPGSTAPFPRRRGTR